MTGLTEAEAASAMNAIATLSIGFSLGTAACLILGQDHWKSVRGWVCGLGVIACGGGFIACLVAIFKIAKDIPA